MHISIESERGGGEGDKKAFAIVKHLWINIEFRTSFWAESHSNQPIEREGERGTEKKCINIFKPLTAK